MKTASRLANPSNAVGDEAEREGTRIARAIFRCGNEANSPCTRIQFKGGKWPDSERNQGGICETSLATLIADCIRNPQRGT